MKIYIDIVRSIPVYEDVYLTQIVVCETPLAINLQKQLGFLLVL